MHAVKMESKRRERTAKTPTLRESQVKRTAVSHTIAAPSTKVARRQCSIRLKTPETTTAAQNRPMNVHCSQPGSGDGFRLTSCGLDTGSIEMAIQPLISSCFRKLFSALNNIGD